jgi:hypothetical protein
MLMVDINRALDFLNKANKNLDWANYYLEEMRKSGRQRKFDEVERNFWVSLTLFESIYQSLVDAAKKLDMEEWRDDLIEVRQSDSLLHYMWKARNSEVHDALVKWIPGMEHVNMRVIDAMKVSRIAFFRTGWAATAAIFCYVYEVRNEEELIELFRKNPPLPSKEKQFEAGVEVIDSLSSFSLLNFSIGQGRGKKTIYAPTTHMGNIILPSADVAMNLTLEFYQNKLNEISEEYKRKNH